MKGLNFVQLILENQPLTGHFGYEYSWYAFKAPEVDSEFVHDKSVDLWSLGAFICTYHFFRKAYVDVSLTVSLLFDIMQICY